MVWGLGIWDERLGSGVYGFEFFDSVLGFRLSGLGLGVKWLKVGDLDILDGQVLGILVI